MSKTKSKKQSNKSRPRQSRKSAAKSESVAQDSRKAVARPKIDSTPVDPRFKIGFAIAMMGVFFWAYWPTFLELVSQWERIPDYSHGFLVAPLAIGFLWIRRDLFPGISAGIAWPGLILILLAGVMRSVSAYYYLEALDGWSIPIWLAGFTLLFTGWKAFWWASPAIAFLFFMVPLPYTLEHMLAGPLQSISTKISVFSLQCLMQPAVGMGNTITLGEHNLEVERACSGLRIFYGIAAMAYAFAILFRRPLWVKMLLFISVLPIALIANSIRIVGTGLLYQWGYGDTAQNLAHDIAGWAMIPLAALLFGIFLFYLDKLFPAIQAVDSTRLVQSQVATGSESN